jgi:ABC-type multidrug transport system fused ATPase/permease subunit
LSFKQLKHLARLNPYFWKYRGRFGLGILFIVLSNIFNVYAPVLIGEGIDFLSQALSAKQRLEAGESGVEVPYPESLSTLASWTGGEKSAVALNDGNFGPTVMRIG